MTVERLITDLLIWIEQGACKVDSEVLIQCDKTKTPETDLYFDCGENKSLIIRSSSND